MKNEIIKLQKCIDDIDKILQEENLDKYISNIESNIETTDVPSIAGKVFEKIKSEQTINFKEEKQKNVEKKKSEKLQYIYGYLRVACFAFIITTVSCHITPYINEFKNTSTLEAKIQKKNENFKNEMEERLQKGNKELLKKIESRKGEK